MASRKHEVEHITTMTLDEARKRVAAGESQTDWARVDALTDADIDRAIAGDPDAAPRLGTWFWDNAELLSAAAAADKIPVMLRIGLLLNPFQRPDREIAFVHRHPGVLIRLGLYKPAVRAFRARYDPSPACSFRKQF